MSTRPSRLGVADAAGSAVSSAGREQHTADRQIHAAAAFLVPAAAGHPLCRAAPGPAGGAGATTMPTTDSAEQPPGSFAGWNSMGVVPPAAPSHQPQQRPSRCAPGRGPVRRGSSRSTDRLGLDEGVPTRCSRCRRGRRLRVTGRVSRPLYGSPRRPRQANPPRRHPQLRRDRFGRARAATNNPSKANPSSRNRYPTNGYEMRRTTFNNVLTSE